MTQGKARRRRRWPVEPGTGLAMAGVALLAAGGGLAWLMTRVSAPDDGPHPELAVPILAGVVLLYVGLIINRRRMGPRSNPRIRWRRPDGAPAGEPRRGRRRFGTGLLLAGIAGLGVLTARGSDGYGAWMMSGLAAFAGVAILVWQRVRPGAG